MAALRVAAAAKLNLYLHVLGRRADGYHLLDSLIAFASVHDTVEAEPAAALSLALRGPFAAALAGESDNLVLRAARLLEERRGSAGGAALTLTKRLPPASGIGGGSADAAATLRALMRLWRLEVATPELMAMGLALGADVPACLLGHAAFAGGIGEALVPAPMLPEAALLLVNPGIALSTQAVFRAREGAFSEAARFAERPRDAAALAALLSTRRNDLGTAAEQLCPAIAEVLAALASAPGCLLARMSGSGATCFGLFAEAGAAAQAARALSRPGWWVAPATLVNDAAVLAPLPESRP